MTNNREHICKYYFETVNNYVYIMDARQMQLGELRSSFTILFTGDSFVE